MLISSLHAHPDRDRIQRVTDIAKFLNQSRISAAKAVNVVAQSLRRAPAPHKVPVLYCLDSILKNAAGNFTTLFAPRLKDMFSSTFSVVGRGDRKK